MGRKIDVDELVDTTDVAAILGLSNPSGVSVYRRRYDNFPVPVIARGRCVLWLRADVLKWLASRDAVS